MIPMRMALENVHDQLQGFFVRFYHFVFIITEQSDELCFLLLLKLKLICEKFTYKLNMSFVSVAPSEFYNHAESIKTDKSLIKFNTHPAFEHTFPWERAKIPEPIFI